MRDFRLAPFQQLADLLGGRATVNQQRLIHFQNRVNFLLACDCLALVGLQKRLVIGRISLGGISVWLPRLFIDRRLENRYSAKPLGYRGCAVVVMLRATCHEVVEQRAETQGI